MQTVFEDDRTVLVSSQNGVTARLDLNNMQRQAIGAVQAPERPQPVYRWYWTTPLIVSSFNPDTIYTGANVLFRSDDRGVSWRAISPDLTANLDREQLQMMGGPVPQRALSRHDGQASFSALTAIAESPLDANVLYTGADDGTLQVTRDGGKRWTNLGGNLPGLPPRLNISGIVASKYAAGRVYVTVDGHFDDDYRPYVYVSENYGKNWRAIVDGLPQTSVHRLREHPGNPNLLVAGLETGVFASFDRGAHWTSLDTNLPPVPVYDLVFQERDHALVLGTHGRGIWILDHAEPLGQLTGEVLDGHGYLFPIPDTHYRTIYSGQYWFGAGEFFAPNPPRGAVLTYYLPAASAQAEISIADASGKTVRTLNGPAQAGINRTCWDLHRSGALENGVFTSGNCGATVGRPGPLVLPGDYTVTLNVPGLPAMSAPLKVLPDPEFPLSDADRQTRETAVMSAYSLEQQLAAARDSYQTLSGQILSARGNPGAAPAFGKVMLESGEVQEQLSQALNDAYNLQSTMDAYEGLPTAAQLRELDWAWQDAVNAVGELNRLIQQDLPALGVTAVPAAPVPVKP
jgi:hypothetical protein